MSLPLPTHWWRARLSDGLYRAGEMPHERDGTLSVRRSVLPRPRGGCIGVTIGIVTNNHDPEGLGRVKLKLPWLSEDIETHWARVATPMAGNGRGLYVLPDVDDEVLVAFEHGMVEFPYVLGSLWNGKDTPPETNEDGKNNRRTPTLSAGPRHHRWMIRKTRHRSASVTGPATTASSLSRRIMP